MNTTPKIIASILIALLFLPSFAQELKTKKIQTFNYLEIFTIDKKSKLKNGEYLKIDSKSKDTLISGTFKDDLKTGIWKYNSKDSKLWITYDYDKKMLTRLSDEINSSNMYVIRKGDSFVSEKVDSPPIYIGYKDEIVNTLRSNLRPPVQILEAGIPVVAVASFVVDIKGNMKDFQIVKASSTMINPSVFAAFKKLDGEWSPAIYNGQPVESQVFLIFDVKRFGTSSTLPTISNAVVINFEYYSITRTVEIRGANTVPLGSNPQTRRY